MRKRYALLLDHPYHDRRDIPDSEKSIFIRVYNDDEIREYLDMADENTAAIGYTEHGFRHALQVSQAAGYILESLGHSEEQVECARVAGFMHDVGNIFGRMAHGQTGAMLAYPILTRLGFTNYQKAIVLGAIGNHEEEYGTPLNSICAAVIIADKSDVHRSRVRKYDPRANDIHDDVNYACVKSGLVVDGDIPKLTLELEIDTQFASVMQYFEIFLDRMVISRKAAEKLSTSFELIINHVTLS
ncbi:HD domain-containing protein [bacterium]|nr:HD domain-containing protein [bacterium]